MAISDGILPEFDHEMGNTRRTLERVPNDKFDWKPHPKSMALGVLAAHVALLPSWGRVTMETASFDMNPPGGQAYQPPSLKSREDILAFFDKEIPVTRAAIAGASDQALLAPWSLLNGGQTIFTLPRIAALRGMILNHMIHHRAQLGVYLRLNDLPVPAIYGPSADEARI